MTSLPRSLSPACPPPSRLPLPAVPAGPLVLLLTALVAAPGAARAQQVADTSFAPPIAAPAFALGAGPVVLIDEGHHNFHTASGRFAAFARLVARDGFVVRPHAGRFTGASLESARVLVISNALEARNRERWQLPVWSALDSGEVRVVERWVRGGGTLLLVADHMPFGGAAEQLAATFGILMSNGFAQDATGESQFTLRRGGGLLRPHAITDGRGPGERVDSVRVFTGQAFRAVVAVETLLVMGPGSIVLLPEVAWEFSPRTPRVRADGMLVGAALQHGRGRVVVFGEAAMLTAQLAGPRRERMGMNAPEAADHPKLVLNAVRWLAGGTRGGTAGPPRGR